MALAAVSSSSVSLNNPSSTSGATAATPTPVAPSKRAASFAMTAANLAADAGVIASFSGGSAALDSTTQLYNSLVNAGQNSAASTTSAVSAALGLTATANSNGTSTTASTGTSATDSGTTTDATAAGTDGSSSTSPAPGSGAAWASILKANPMMAPMAAQLTQRQQIVDMLA